MENVDFLKIVSQVFPFVGAHDAQVETDQCPEMNHVVVCTVVFRKLVDLGVAVMAASNAIGGAGGLDLVVLLFPIGQAFFLESRLEESAAAAATIVVGFIGLHVDKVFFTHNGFHNKAQVIGNGVTIALADNLAGILNREFNLQILIPIGVDLEFAFPDPFCVVFVNIFNLVFVFKTIFFQSGPD